MTTRDEKIQILNECLVQCKDRLKLKNNNRPLLIIKEVIEELISVASGNEEASPNMEENNKIGLFAVREFEPHDIEFADSIFKIIGINNELRKT